MGAQLNVPLTGLANLIDARDAVSANYLKVEKIAAPYTVVQNRALMPDLSKDLGVRIGTQRIMTQALVEAEGETTATGARVYKVVGDTFDQIRVIGDIHQQNDNEGIRLRFETPNTLDKIEITFYGTGLNVLHKMTTGTSTLDYAVNGVATGSLEFLGAVLTSNYMYDTNVVKSVVSGLTLGLYTVTISNKLGWSGNPDIYGFEVLTDISTLNIRPGTVYGYGSAYTLQSAQNIPYSTIFDSGSLGSRGGNVIVYLKEDGTIGKSVTPAGAALYLTSTDHTNETVVKKLNYYDFNSNRSDCLGNIGSGTDNAFTLDDGSTTITTKSCTIGAQNGINGFTPSTTDKFFVVDFIGTGLDVLAFHASTNTDTVRIYIDGVEITSGATAASTIFGTPLNKWTKICSGLKYGSHTALFIRKSAAASFPFFGYFKVYAPTEPTLPSNAKKIAQYYLLGDYAGISSISDYTNPGFVPSTISQGVIRKTSMREILYSGTWSAYTFSTASTQTGYVQGTTTTGAYWEYTFWGTGIDIYSQTNAGASQLFNVTVDTNSNLSSFTTALISSTTGMTWTASTGVIGGTPVAVSAYCLRISGLTLGKHTVRMTKGAGVDSMYFNGLDVITPIHSYQYNSVWNRFLLGNSMVARQVYPESYVAPTFTKAVAFYKDLSAQTFATGVYDNLFLDTKVQDNFKVVNGNNGKAYAPFKGKASVKGIVWWVTNANWTLGESVQAWLSVNGDLKKLIGIDYPQTTASTYNANFPVVAEGWPVEEGDFVAIRMIQNNGVTGLNTSTSDGYTWATFTFEKDV